MKTLKNIFELHMKHKCNVMVSLTVLDMDIYSAEGLSSL